MSMQSIVCRLEAARFHPTISHGNHEAVDEALEQLLAFIAPFKGLLGAPASRIQEYMQQYHDLRQAPSKQLEALSRIDRIVAFLEA